MINNVWEKIGTEDDEYDRLWELYHQNSKITRLDKTISVDELREKTLDLIISNTYEQYPSYKLSDELEVWVMP